MGLGDSPPAVVSLGAVRMGSGHWLQLRHSPCPHVWGERPLLATPCTSRPLPLLSRQPASDQDASEDGGSSLGSSPVAVSSREDGVLDAQDRCYAPSRGTVSRTGPVSVPGPPAPWGLPLPAQGRPCSSLDRTCRAPALLLGTVSSAQPVPLSQPLAETRAPRRGDRTSPSLSVTLARRWLNRRVCSSPGHGLGRPQGGPERESWKHRLFW